MTKRKIYSYIALGFMPMTFAACNLPKLVTRVENKITPASYNNGRDTTNTARMKWREYFTDPFLVALIDTALSNNQELNIMLQEIALTRNEVRIRKGEYLPFAGIKAGAGADKVGRYTNIGALEHNIQIEPGRDMPEPLADYQLAAYARWEVDIWHKLRNAKKSAVSRYLATTEGRNFVVTQMIAEVANSYYELLALDNQLAIVQQNIGLQTNALEIVKLQKEATRVTELAVRKFEAEVLNTRSLQYDIQQRITETENRINFLLGRYPQAIARNDQSLNTMMPTVIHVGVPAQLLENRPDVRRAELELAASKLDVKVAKADFYPSLGISVSVGVQAFNPAYLIKIPESIITSLVGDLVAPLVNRNSIKAKYYMANARQIQAIYNYERTVLNAYIEVANQLSKIGNLEKAYELRSKQVDALTTSITISGDLFRSARADYMEVLLTQRDALQSRFELVETKKQQMNAVVNVYQALGGGW